ncbi:uncharacterized protein LOC105217326 [Zeugodacus cucurbitae]|uniref:uncharacterized protein LOC105217326 n=1 Tax=Zeugodacus cucurbitae TaxID=28588 RepID=UPI0005968ED6|nr:uncharacterized protein LOC105217326 [Zeugodacus cucurbitae]
MKRENMNSPKAKRKRLSWTEGAELAVLDLWAEYVVELRAARKNMHIYEKISEGLAQLGYMYNGREVQVKVANFTQRYRNEKAYLMESGASISSWSHYGRVHQIIGRFKTNSFCESTMKSIQGESCNASCFSPTVPPSAPSSPVPLPPVPSPPASPHTSNYARVTHAKKKKAPSQFQMKVLDKFEELSTEIIQYLRNSEENERQLLEVERQKAECMKKFREVNTELKDAIIKFLEKK